MISNIHSSQSEHVGGRQYRLDTVDFSTVISALRRNFFLIVAIIGLSIAAAYFYLIYMAVPLYSATATIVLNSSQSNIASLDPTSGGEPFQDSAALNTEIAVLRSNGLLARIVELENLTQDYEFNPHLTDDPAAVTDPVMLAQRTLPDTIAALRNSLTVSNERGSYVISITATTTDPAKSQRIANSVAQAYLDNQVLLKTETTQNAVIWLQQRVDDLQQQLIEAGVRVGEFQFSSESEDRFEDSVRLERLNSEAQVIRELHQHFLKRLKEATVQQGLHRPDGRILSRAEMPAEPGSPRKRVILFFSAIIGGIAALGVVFVREALSDTLRSPMELERITGLPLIGATPRVPRGIRQPELSGLISRHAPQYISALEDLQAGLVMSTAGPRHKVIALCSAVAGEGRTSLVMSLAAGLAESRNRVLVIDADLRRRSLTRLVEPKSSTGLVALCQGRASFDEAVTHNTVLNADLMFCEEAPKRPVDLLTSDTFRKVMASAESRYDYVLVDTSPILDAPDVRLLGRHVDSLVFLSQWNATPEGSVRAAVDVLGRAGLTPAGVVMTRISSARFKQARYDILPGGGGKG
ncbi:GumC family protein [Amaricoccus tamworthensis]|uniref:GumC family protein n=1 Tax=Amaricoccus tamworthensis TaxID=57002 RepID=UPI003C7986E5